MTTIHQSARQYEDWLREQLHGDVLEQDLAKKHDKMREGAFVFLRATYWRWAETILDVCPDLAGGTQVFAVGTFISKTTALGAMSMDVWPGASTISTRRQRCRMCLISSALPLAQCWDVDGAASRMKRFALRSSKDIAKDCVRHGL
jgi:hypothetical protein